MAGRLTSAAAVCRSAAGTTIALIAFLIHADNKNSACAIGHCPASMRTGRAVRRELTVRPPNPLPHRTV